MTEGQITILKKQILIISMDRYNPKPVLDNINAYTCVAGLVKRPCYLLSYHPETKIWECLGQITL